MKRIAIVVLLAVLFPLVPNVAAQTPSIDWVRQFSSFNPANDSGQAIDADGNVYVVGRTDGFLPGQINAGGVDAFVRKYDIAGNELWTQQFGTTSFDVANTIAVDATGVYVAGNTGGAIPGQVMVGSGDAFVRKYDTAGAELWTRQFGATSSTEAFAIAVDATGVYVGGAAAGALPGQIHIDNRDAFVRKYDGAGNEVWTRQFGTIESDYARAIAVDATGIYVGGFTGDALPGQVSAGFVDAFVCK